MSNRQQILAEIAQVQRELELLKQEQLILKSDGLRFYDPAGSKHDLFHRMGEKKYRYVRCGNRFGKSEMGAAEDIAWLRGERSWIPATDPARFAGIPKRAVRLLLVVENWEKSNDVFTNLENGKFWKYIPKEAFVSYSLGHSGSIDCIKVKSIWGGISMLKIQTIASFKQSPQTTESSQWDAIHVDEPCPRELWVAASRGLMDSNGKAWFTCTPLIHPWINRFFLPSNVQLSDKSEPYVLTNKIVITGNSYDNKHLAKEAVDEYASTLTKEERETRLFGQPSSEGGVVYGEFDLNLHVYREDKLPNGWSELNRPPDHYMVRAAIDTHERTPQAVLHEATISDGKDLHIYYYQEQFDSRYVDTTCHRFNEITKELEVNQILFDPRAYIQSPVDDSTLADVFMSHGIVGEPAPKDPKRAIIAVKTKLKERTENGQVTIHFAENLVETLFEFENYLWDPKKQNDPIPENNHMMENLGRLLMTHPGIYINPKGKSEGFFPQVPVSGNQSLNLNVKLST